MRMAFRLFVSGIFRVQRRVGSGKNPIFVLNLNATIIEEVESVRNHVMYKREYRYHFGR